MRSDDELIELVLQELHRDPRVEVRHLGVEVTAGTVTLTGTAANCARAAAAGTAAARVQGLREVINQILVAVPEHQIRSDLEVADAVDRLLEWDAEVPHESVQGRVVGGIVTLDGRVEHEYERDVAERAIRHLAGVRGVVNRIAVSTPVPRGIQRDVAAVLDWPTATAAQGPAFGPRAWGRGPGQTPSGPHG